ncbi:aldehyde dehydrogenase [Rickenella mellea]|uniref:Aldehyde dehydrogenase n=1 Tax=Rickenella mellea TaxID=50990 RepID=A0A4Y7PJD9_9AGAM|nr:aldehyde dehydrogenase [Rickenella mellea]
MSSTLKFTPLDEIEQIHALLYKTFKSKTCHPLSYRRTQLHKLARLVQENAELIADAIHKDLGKPKFEVYMAETGPIVERCLISAKSLEEWSKDETPEVPEWQKAWKPTVHKTPKGPVLIISPWNYPLILSLQSLTAAISAGCPAAIKPSELVPNFSQLLAELIPKYLDQSAYRVVNGGAAEATKLLQLRWAHIFYTGNGRIGRIVATAAAQHLTPVSLELGGKCPVLIDPEYDIDLAAKRILWGKVTNAGQTCIAPDYILTTPSTLPPLLTSLRNHLTTFYPSDSGGPLSSPNYAHIVSRSHFNRITSLLKRTKGKVEIGGKWDEEKLSVEPSVVVLGDATQGGVEEDALMEDEIFGPVLPVVLVESVQEMVDFVNARDQPLAAYAFSENEGVRKQILENTISGGLFFNDTFQQLAVNEIPFSGVGPSGYGAQVLKYGFNDFTHLRSSITMPAAAEPHLAVRYPPYTDDAFKFMAALTHLPIPPVHANGDAQ